MLYIIIYCVKIQFCWGTCFLKRRKPSSSSSSCSQLFCSTVVLCSAVFLLLFMANAEYAGITSLFFVVTIFHNSSTTGCLFAIRVQKTFLTEAFFQFFYLQSFNKLILSVFNYTSRGKLNLSLALDVLTHINSVVSHISNMFRGMSDLLISKQIIFV